MFKSVEYAGFDGRPELKTKAEQLTPVLAGEIHTWRESVEVRWNPHPNPDGLLDLTLSLTLPNGVSGSVTGTFRPIDFARTSRLASRCGRVWSNLLGELIQQLDARVMEYVFDTAEA